MSASGYVGVEVVRIKAATELALLCLLENEYGEEGDEHWIPRSLLDDDGYAVGDEALTLEIPKWFLDKNEIEYEEK